MTRLRVAVVGAGPMGRLHARTVSASAARDGDCVLAAIVDRHAARAAHLAGEHRVAALDDLRRLREVDAAIVAVPTAGHVESALLLVEAGLDVLVEKPLAADLEAGSRLVERAQGLGRILQVGHVEWYNPRWRDALARAGEPRRIDVRRLHPRSGRSLDIDVVQDLMLHDLDWVTRVLGEDVATVEASGRHHDDGELDEAEVSLQFRSGCVVRLTASRVHPRRERRLEIAGSRATVVVDLLAPGDAPSTGRTGRALEARMAEAETAAPAGLDPLGLQWRAFVAATRTRQAPENDGRIGLAAMRWVERVREAIRAVEAAGAVGGHDSRFRG